MADRTIEYYFSLNSPWTYFGHDRLRAMSTKHAKRLKMIAVDFSIVFPATGGLPLPERAPARQAYRLTELERWRTYLGVPLNQHPAHWPANELTAVGAVMRLCGETEEPDSDAMVYAGALMHAVWAQDRDIGARDTLLAVADECGIDGGALLGGVQDEETAREREANSHAAIERGVFGAPSYIYAGELFWGQDRLEFLERALAKAR